MQGKLHYIYDPLCGWCYAAAPLIQAAAELANSQITMHAGGLWVNERRQPLGKALRDYVKPHDDRIHTLTGQVFGERYFNELLLNESLVLDSEPLIQAILAIEQMGGNSLVMLQRLQQTHYRDGIWTGNSDVQAELVAEQGISAADFESAKQRVNAATHMQESRELMNKFKVSGFPALILLDDQHSQVIPLAQYYGLVDAFKTYLLSLS